MAKYGLLGKDLSHSFSKAFFTNKFEKEKRKATYHNFELESLDLFPELTYKTEGLKGLNVTIPYKEEIIPYLDKIDKEAAKIGAVNTIKFGKNGKLIGYNTDHYGFAKALADYFPIKEKTALILGSGGASKAISYVLDAMEFDYEIVARTPSIDSISYDSLDREIMEDHLLIVNCTPIGTSPNVEDCPRIPYQYIGEDHVLFDLIYNPTETEFMKRGFVRGARVSNGLKMLEYQAQKAWKIWNS
ncbi:shikimate dehydrogenase [Aureitalea sp. L0-47]|uniref:shikimate dehydrogenase family protein n=1 Tax=Aureitalea sp. L0-47 TaxID=2816962 RepID=UPI0022388671|nr:shikimate dehydrogenase [Aureitalea sp. L0-47]MCW5520352.1 shikimate dehydrogenase [Aureitalea sp. L0-47]